MESLILLVDFIAMCWIVIWAAKNDGLANQKRKQAERQYSMRDLLFVPLFVFLVAFTFKRPYIGVCLWAWDSTTHAELPAFWFRFIDPL